jgi:hypothetical protein
MKETDSCVSCAIDLIVLQHFYDTTNLTVTGKDAHEFRKPVFARLNLFLS